MQDKKAELSHHVAMSTLHSSEVDGGERGLQRRKGHAGTAALPTILIVSELDAGTVH